MFNDDFNFYEEMGIPDVDGSGNVDMLDAMLTEEMIFGNLDESEKDNFDPMSSDFDYMDPFEFNKDIF